MRTSKLRKTIYGLHKVLSQVGFGPLTPWRSRKLNGDRLNHYAIRVVLTPEECLASFVPHSSIIREKLIAGYAVTRCSRCHYGGLRNVQWLVVFRKSK